MKSKAEDVSNEKNIKTKFKIMVQHIFDNHYCISNLLQVEKGKCSGMTSDYMMRLTEARDRELCSIVNGKPNDNSGDTYFKDFILLLLRCHIEGEGIINYFSWHKKHANSKKGPIRLSSVVDLTKKKQLTVEAVIGSNEGELRDKLNKNTNIQTKNKKRDREIKSWETFWDDMIFLDKLAMIGCYESKNDKFKSLIPRIYNKKVISQHDQLYYVGFPQEANKDATVTGKSSSLIRIVEYEWIIIYCNTGFVMRLKKEKNRALILPNPTKKRIKEEMRSLAAKNVTHVHKYKCPTTLTTKYCNAIFNKRGKGTSGPSITIMKVDEISLKWIYNTAVVQE